MTKEVTLLIDVHYLCWRAFFTTGHLTNNGDSTGVIYGFLREIKNLRDRFNTEQIVFCFDSVKSKREEILPTYKSGRKKERTPEEQAAYNGLAEQIKNLRDSILPTIGYRNIFRCSGYEADDLIASITKRGKKEDYIIVSGDADLFQLLSRQVSMYNPRGSELTTDKTFKKKYTIDPEQWVRVKAIAGCKTDNIPGVVGVGEKTAIKFIKGMFDPEATQHKKIRKHKKLIDQNMRLVKLPFVGCPTIEVNHQPIIDLLRWKEVLSEFGIKSLNETQRQGNLFK